MTINYPYEDNDSLPINQNNMNKVNSTDVTFLSLAIGTFSSAPAALLVHDYWVATGMTILGIIFIYCYHKFGSV